MQRSYNMEDINVGICKGCKYYRERQKREKYPHCTYPTWRFKPMILNAEQIMCKKYEKRAEMAE